MDQELALYSAQQSRDLDARAIADFAIPGYALMQRAALAAWRALRAHYPAARRIGFLVGPGNNGGDALELARLAAAEGCQIQVCLLQSPQRFQGEAAQAWQGFVSDGLQCRVSSPDWESAELWVDGLFGSGLTRVVSGQAGQWIEALNRSARPVLALDLPSGLQADTGAVLGSAVQADLSISFIARKAGLFTGAAVDHVGLLLFDDLGLPAALYQGFDPQAWLLPDVPAWSALPQRKPSSYKSSHGHLLLIGGAPGYSGAIRLAAAAALRGGAGLLSVFTHPDSRDLVAASLPEAMVHSEQSGLSLAALLQRADVVLIGPGLGQQDWGRAMLAAALAFSGPCVVDADALNLLAQSHQGLPENSLLTPHPGEAARLLGSSIDAVQADRFAAARALATRYQAHCVLKGAGSLVARPDGVLRLCRAGNPGMAVAGMGDVLAGLAAALAAQLPAEQLDTAATAAVLAHAQAGDQVARNQGQRGMLPTDLIATLPGVLNP